MDRTFIDLWVGIFVAAGIVALMVLALKVGNASTTFHTGDTYRINAQFDNIGGLKVRAPVKSAGVVVGRVAQIKLDPKSYEAVAVLNIDPSYKFSKDTIGSILTSGLMGEQYVSLDPGGDTVFLKDGERLAKTQSAVVLEKLLSQFLYNKAAEKGDKK